MERFVLSLIGMAAGILFGAGGLYLLLKQKFVTRPDTGLIEVEIPLFGRIRTNYPAALFIFFGAILIIYPLAQWPRTLAKIPVEGTVIIQNRSSFDGAVVGILPSSQMAITRTQGDYEVEVLAGENSYTGIAYYTEAGKRYFYSGGVEPGPKVWKFDAYLRDEP